MKAAALFLSSLRRWAVGMLKFTGVSCSPNPAALGWLNAPLTRSEGLLWPHSPWFAPTLSLPSYYFSLQL